VEYCLDDLLAPEEKRWRIQFMYLQSEIYYRIWDLAKAEELMKGCHAQADDLGYTEYFLRSSLDLVHLKLLKREEVDIQPYITAVDNKVSFLIRQHLLTNLNYKKALIFSIIQDHTKARDYVTSALSSAERMDQKETAARCNLLLSSVGDEKGIDLAMQALDIADTIKMPPLIGEALYQLTQIYKTRNDLEKARYYGRKALLVYDDLKFKLHKEHQEIFSRRPEYLTLLEV
jgi:tetratricopeptide (TPR) repeat protein